MLTLINWLICIQLTIIVFRLHQLITLIVIIKKEVSVFLIEFEEFLKLWQKKHYEYIDSKTSHNANTSNKKDFGLIQITLHNSVTKTNTPKTIKTTFLKSEYPNLFTTIHDLLVDLDNVFKVAGRNPGNNKKLFRALQVTLSKYNITDTAFQSFINDYIDLESQNKCSIHLSAEELREMWKR